ncbi:MAG: GNAT family N-acetyltransferase [Chloroflexota bacterium]|nr:GNAT family N-acetyltransferase [Chloroflexota bacterium]
MPDADIVLRRANSRDTEPCYQLFMESVADLTARQGTPWDPDVADVWLRLEPMFNLLAEHAAEWWVAEDTASGELAGYARSVERGGLFELSEFFVRPNRQSAGVGRRLLAAAFPLGRGAVRAIIATTAVRAMARYYRAGTVPRFPIFALSRPLDPGDAAEQSADNAPEPVRATTADLPLLAEIERSVLEFDRGPAETTWLLTEREGYLYLRDGHPVAFGFIGKVGSGPVVALSPEDQPFILTHLEGRARALGRENLALEVPSINHVAMRHLLDRGYQMDSFLTLLLSSRPFGQFDRFIGFAPPFVL